MNLAARTPVQTAWVSRELNATEAALARLLGVRKWVRMPGVRFGPDDCTYRGEPADFSADISLSYLGDMQLELIAPMHGRSIYHDFLAAAGPGLHHICVAADSAEDFDARCAAAVAGGADLVQHGTMAGGMQFAYLAAPQAGVPYLEIAHFPAEIRAFFDYIKQEQR